MEQRITDCPICLGAFMAPLITNCGHTFCATCLRGQLASGLVNARTCANCRGIITSVTQNFAIETEVNETAEADRVWVLQNHARDVRALVPEPTPVVIRRSIDVAEIMRNHPTFRTAILGLPITLSRKEWFEISDAYINRSLDNWQYMSDQLKSDLIWPPASVELVLFESRPSKIRKTILHHAIQTKSLPAGWTRSSICVKPILNSPETLRMIVDAYAPLAMFGPAIGFEILKRMNAVHVPSELWANEEIMKTVCVYRPSWLPRVHPSIQKAVVIHTLQRSDAKVWTSVPADLKRDAEVLEADGRDPCGCKKGGRHQAKCAQKAAI